MKFDDEAPLRILIVGTTYRPAANGQAVFTTNLAEGLADFGHEVAAAVPSERWRSYRERRNGVAVEGLAAMPVGNLPDARFTPFPLPGLRRIFEQFDPQVVHLQDHYPLSRWAYGLARRRDLPVLGTNHFIPENIVHYVMPLEWGRSGAIAALWWTMQSLYDRLDMVTTPTQTAAEIVCEAGL
ncbi:MAG: glycosyltransferase, partial [Anaerolineales bacterium]|nr:glycosyltransferase [Anaerolineales bacterium]